MIGSGYVGLSKIYDRLMADFPYSEVVRFLFEELSPRGKRGLDLCAGTGTIALALAEAGARMTAVDRSVEMLNVARDKARGAGQSILFLRADVNRLPEMQPFDFAVSVCDGLNYVKDPAAFAEKLFSLVVPGGKIALEFSSLFKAEHVLANELYYEDNETETYFFQNEYRKKSRSVRQELTIFQRLPDGNYRRSDDASAQYFYRNDALLSAFSNAGFTEARLLSTGSFSPAQPDSERLTLTASRPR